MAHIERSALLPYSAQQMFDLVNDIGAYPRFMQGCIEAEVLEQSDKELLGRLTLAKAGVRQTFTTRNRLVRPTAMEGDGVNTDPVPERGSSGSIDMKLEEGDFKAFSARWEFKPLSDTACKVSLRMDFEFRPGFIDRALQLMFNSSANNLVDALIDRAHQVYG